MQIVVLDGAILNPGDNPWTPLEELGELTVYPDSAEDQIIHRASHATVLITNKAPLSAATIQALPNLRYIGVVATGYNVVDVKAAAAQHIPVCNVVAYGVDSVAQHVLALMLELSRRTSLHDASVKAGDWTRSGQWCYWNSPQVELTDMTMGIMGFGNIGRRVGELCHCFGMEILACQRSPHNPPAYSPFRFVDEEELFARSDIISLHCPLTDTNQGMVNAARLARMKPGALLINTARGPLLDEVAVAAALHSGQLGGLGADVLSQEPPVADNPLLHAPHTIITPHLSWATLKARRNITRLAAENIKAWLAGSPTHVVNM